MITAAGAGSGIDVENILSQLMEIERAPVRALDARRERLDVELSAFGSVKSAMSELASSASLLGDTTRFGPFIASSSDEAVFTATAGGTAAAETHDIDVISLAAAHRVASDAKASSEADMGSGTWAFDSGDTSFSVELDAGNRSMLALRDAINDATDNDAIVASLLNVDGGTRLILNAREGGTASAITVTPPSAADTFTEITAAADASLIVDGFAVTSSSNTVSDVIEGVSLELVGAGSATLGTARDTDSLRESLDTFVENYNALRTQLSELSAGDLQGDRLPRDAELRLRSTFALPIMVGDVSLQPTELGFTFDRYGMLSIDEARLAAAQTASLERFVDAFAVSDTGFAARLADSIDEFTRADGLISDREDGIDSRRASLDQQTERLEYRLEQTEARLRRQFVAMDQVVSQLQSTSAFLTDRLASF